MKSNRFARTLAVILGGSLLATGTAFSQDKAPAAKPDAPKASRNQDAPPAPGSGPRGQRMTPEERLKRLTEQLTLTEAQKAKVEAVLKAEREKRQKLRQDTTLSDDSRQAKSRELREETKKEMKKVLTAEQFEKWEKSQQNRGPGAGNRPARPQQNQ